MRVREAAVAGQFYPADPTELGALVEGLLEEAARLPHPPVESVRAYVVPHAGLVYSGPVAAVAYAHLRRGRAAPARVLLIGPSHRVALRGLAVSSASAFATPLGPIPVAVELRDRLVAEGLCQLDDEPHALEHSLEVQLPFLRRVLPEVELLPVVGGAASPEAVAALFDAVWDDPSVLVLVSTDLSHFHTYDACVAIDAKTATLLEALDPSVLESDRACGRVGLGGLIALARKRPLELTRLDLRNSGDISGQHDRVVGYGAWAVTDDPLRR